MSRSVVVLDTNALGPIYGPSADLLMIFRAQEPAGFEVVLPDVVIQEIGALDRRSLEEKITRARGQIAKLSTAAEVLQGIDRGLDARPEYIAGELRGYAAAVIPVPAVATEEALSRAISKRAPFASGNDGFKDFVIWKSLLSFLRENPDVIDVCLITSNKHDFGESPVLHQDLQQDLVELGFKGTFEVVTSPSDYVEARLQKTFDLIDEHGGKCLENLMSYDDLAKASHDIASHFSSFDDWSFIDLRDDDNRIEEGDRYEGVAEIYPDIVRRVRRIGDGRIIVEARFVLELRNSAVELTRKGPIYNNRSVEIEAEARLICSKDFRYEGGLSVRPPSWIDGIALECKPKESGGRMMFTMNDSWAS